MTDDDTKVIVRSNGTVGYVGKDIAYHLWKFGLLGRDFGYRKFYRYPMGLQCWISATDGETEHPHFGDVSTIYNVIDTRQAEAQNTVIEALRALGYGDAADHYTHFSYEMVALTPRCASDMGYPLSEDEMGKAFIEVSGRRGFGVKADDLIDRLIASARKKSTCAIPSYRNQNAPGSRREIAIGALRYFMLKFTKTSVIAFDFKEALSFEGETGPYAQYAVVRATNIFRKAGITPEQVLACTVDFDKYFEGETGDRNLGSLAARRRRPPPSSTSALRPPNRPMRRNTHSSWRSCSTTSTTAITSSMSLIRSGSSSCSRPLPSRGAS